MVKLVEEDRDSDLLRKRLKCYMYSGREISRDVLTSPTSIKLISRDNTPLSMIVRVQSKNGTMRINANSSDFTEDATRKDEPASDEYRDEI